jgi:tRNA nucleotidyltransferase (CCA-adding enzyme)
MNKKGNIVDLLNGKEDIVNKKIKVIGDVNKKFTEDPLRMLRAIRFSTTLGFNIEGEALEFIINHKNLINSLSYQRRKNELNLILISKNYQKGLDFIKEISVDKELEIKYDKVIKTDDLLGMWAQITYSDNYPCYSKKKRNY